MATPELAALSDCVRDCVQAYVNANQGSDQHPLGKAKVGSVAEYAPSLTTLQSVKGGFCLRYEDGTTFFVNVHRMPADPLR